MRSGRSTLGGVVRGVVEDRDGGVAVEQIAGAFHATLAQMIRLGCERVREQTGLMTVALSGGVFMNALLVTHAEEALRGAGFRVLIPRAVPCNDGGLSLGQAYVAGCALREELCV